jgi:hypothetical protein
MLPARKLSPLLILFFEFYRLDCIEILGTRKHPIKEPHARNVLRMFAFVKTNP